MTINERIAIVRKELGLSMEAFGKQINISRAAVNQIEKGTNSPSEQTKRLICDTFRINRGWLDSGTGPMYIETSRSEEILEFTAEILSEKDGTFKKKLFVTMARLSESDWIVLEKIITDLAKED